MKKIAVLGTGVVAQTIAEKLNALGYQVMMGTRNVQQSLAREGKDSFGRPPLKEWLQHHSGIQLGTFSEAAAWGDFLVNATSGHASLEVLDQAGKENLNGKILLDIANPLDFSKGMPPSLTICNTDSLGERIQQAIPELKVVKALNTMNAFIMVNPSLVPGDHNVFLCGNDTQAKDTVRQLLKEFGWKDTSFIDLGDISMARGTEQLLPIWVRLYMTFQNPMFNFHIAMAPAPGK
jgi:8-hydroxy-5-deazaflavin:NADPH oxidoreductase